MLILNLFGHAIPENNDITELETRVKLIKAQINDGLMTTSLKDNNPFVSFWIDTPYPFNISNAVFECLEFCLLLKCLVFVFHYILMFLVASFLPL